MKHIKTYEGFKTPNKEIFDTMKDILLDLEDDGYHVSFSNSDGVNLNRLAFIPPLKDMIVTVCTWHGSMDNWRESIKSFEYSEIKDVFYRLIVYMMSEGYGFKISFSEVESNWVVVDDAITNGIEGKHDYYRILFI